MTWSGGVLKSSQALARDHDQHHKHEEYRYYDHEQNGQHQQRAGVIVEQDCEAEEGNHSGDGPGRWSCEIAEQEDREQGRGTAKQALAATPPGT